MTESDKASDDTMGPSILMQGSPECLRRMLGRRDAKPDYTITKVRLMEAWETSEKWPGFVLVWETVSAGFGELTVFMAEDGKLHCETETMGKEFVRAVFMKFLEELDEAQDRK